MPERTEGLVCPFCGGDHDPAETLGQECPPCQCVWCRASRGDALTREERHMVEARTRANAAFEARQARRKRLSDA